MAETAYEGWAILELMGHRRLAGYVQEVELAGHGMLRLDIPEHDKARCDCDTNDSDGLLHEEGCACVALGVPADVKATQFYSPAALYCLTPTTEEIARRIAVPPRPAQRWELEPPKPAEPQQEYASAALLDDDDDPIDPDEDKPF